MMNDLNELLVELTSRLPELEWRISELGSTISAQQLPEGLFPLHLELTASGCIQEIKEDIMALSQQKNERSAHYLAERIQRKVHVLVRLCQIERPKQKLEKKTHFELKMLSTRQQWIQGLEKDIYTLEAARGPDKGSGSNEGCWKFPFCFKCSG